MAKDCYWHGAVSNNWGTLANWWSDDAGTPLGSLPVDTDSCFFKRGSGPIELGLNQATIDLAELHFDEGYEGIRIGDSAGNPLQINATLLRISTRSVLSIKLSGTFGTVRCEKIGTGNSLVFAAGTTTTFYGGAEGFVQFAADVTLNEAHFGGMNADIGAFATSPPDMSLHISKSSRVDCDRKVTKASVDGFLRMKTNASLVASSGSPEIVVGPGGILDVQCLAGLANGQVIVKDDGFVTGEYMPGAVGAVPGISKLVRHPRGRVTIPTNKLEIATPIDISDNNGAFI